jgi:tRNA uridine 5-carbamoylmethylation protein Kti12
MDSTAQTAPRDSEISNELLSQVTHGFDSPNSPRNSEIINELLSRVTHDFDNPNSP